MGSTYTMNKEDSAEQHPYQQAEESIRRGDFSQAEQILLDYTAAHPSDKEALFELCRVLLAQKKFFEAKTRLSNLQQQFPDHPEVLGLRGLQLQLNDQREEARDLYAQALKHEEIRPWIPYNAGRLALEADDLSWAESLLDRTLQLDADHFPARLERAQLYTRTNRVADAIRDLLQALDTNPLLLPAYLTLAELYLRGGMAQEAVPLLQQGLAHNPFAHSLREALARVFAVVGDQEAAFGLRLELSRLRGLPDDFLELGIAALRKDDPSSAVVAFTKAAQLHPDDWRPRYNLAEIHLAARDFGPALAHYQAALQRNENDRVLNGLALWHLEAQDEQKEASLQEARQLLERALELNPDRVEARYNLAVACHRLQQDQEARQLAADLLEHLNPNSPLYEKTEHILRELKE